MTMMNWQRDKIILDLRFLMIPCWTCLGSSSSSSKFLWRLPDHHRAVASCALAPRMLQLFPTGAITFQLVLSIQFGRFF
jgi:hypothetical protein